jgi:DnaJ domain/Protein of unknown function (DUF3592)
MATTSRWLAFDYYAELGVGPDASSAEIGAAFRALAKDLHPDTRPTDQAAADRFKRVSAAYRVLRDPERRRQYDMLRNGESLDRRSPRRATTATPPVSRRGATGLVAGGIACLVIGVVVAALVVSLQRSDAALRRDGEPATATVVDAGDERGLEFTTADGETVVAQEGVRSGRGEDPLGAEVEIRYDPDDPTDIVRVESNTARDITLWIVAIKLLVGGAILGGIGAWRLRHRADPRPSQATTPVR